MSIQFQACVAELWMCIEIYTYAVLYYGEIILAKQDLIFKLSKKLNVVRGCYMQILLRFVLHPLGNTLSIVLLRNNANIDTTKSVW